MPVIFKARTKQDTSDLFPGVPVAFEDANAEEYFEKVGFADKTDLTPVVTYPVGSVTIDPFTVHSTGSAALVGAQANDHVMPELAAATPEAAPTTDSNTAEASQ